MATPKRWRWTEHGAVISWHARGRAQDRQGVAVAVAVAADNAQSDDQVVRARSRLGRREARQGGVWRVAVVVDKA